MLNNLMSFWLGSLAASLFILAASACTLGPIHITHEGGKLPKVHIDLPVKDCKVKPRISMGDKEVHIVCKIEV